MPLIGLFVYVKDFEQFLLLRLVIFKELQAVPTGISSTATQQESWFPAHPIAAMTCLAPVLERGSPLTKFRDQAHQSQPLLCLPLDPTRVIPHLQHNPLRTLLLRNVQHSNLLPTVSYSPGNVSLVASTPDCDDDCVSSDDHSSNNNSNSLASSTPPRSFRRSQRMALTGTLVICDSKLDIPN